MNIFKACQPVETWGWLRARKFRMPAASILARRPTSISTGCRRLAPAVALALWAALAVPSRAEDALRKELAAVAKGIAEAVKGLGHEAIAVGEFTGPAQLAASGGPAIAKTL